jgi:hypothetical protein
MDKMRMKIDRQKDRNVRLAQEVKVLRKREIEIIKRWDLDDIDLITDRLNNVLHDKPSIESKFKIR